MRQDNTLKRFAVLPLEQMEQPTPEQLTECFRICSELTKMYIPIQLVRLDRRTSEVYILAGDNLQVLVRANGTVRYP